MMQVLADFCTAFDEDGIKIAFLEGKLSEEEKKEGRWFC